MKCKFYDKCKYASSSSMTCSENGGGSYCGKYRMFVSDLSSNASVFVFCPFLVDPEDVSSN
ncbi:hypothetical protein [uncultured Methanolobus sp.]|uniref:hypothetical protein n=1 Tax=uncultured Methanolobus sp. TaxID=218300 RepID=UPI002AAA8323|nr:hypothetical protein [uncultured Methanolobus sp.]